ncbi:MAG: DEAD/DEAH box helicase [Planctomycetota bacterium]|nr:DEAD/DEAH box helicase [Planctomycetota bacterium]
MKATLRFEAAGPGGARGGSFGAEEILRAAARGVPVLERGGALCRVDAETVEQARAALRKLAAADGAAEGKGEGFSAAGEQVPELLEYARARQGDPASPWNVYVSEAVEGAHKVADEPAELRLRLGVEEDASETWFTVDASLDVGGRALTPEEIRELMRKRRQWMYYGRQWRRVDAQSYAAFRLQAERAGLRKTGSGRFRFKPEERAKVESLFSLAGTVEHAERYREFLENLRGFGGMEPQAPPDSLRVTLRPYQREGYSWLRFLQRYGLNGILADEMGLGKTAQTLAALAALRDEQGPWPSLVICPTSLVDNWRAEARKVDPRLKVLRYTGSPGRRDTLRKRIPEMDLVLATYATARNDALLLREESWRYVILDEAHFIKNAAAATTKAVKTIPSRHRLALTGTPVQNRLDELWSLFDFLMPGYLGRFAGFFRRYEEPIVKGQAPDAAATERRDGERAAEALRERIGPFVLRRLKTEVARDLPPKIEQDLFCSLTADQIALYRKFATSDEARAAVKEVEEKGAARAQTQILAALTMLRKICNHPDLVYTAAESEKRKRMTPLAGYAERSGKLLALADLFDQCRAGNHRLLLFCQQTRMLDILEYYLQERGDACLRLDGGTPGHARQGLVDRFNADPSLFVFLISTRAGGSGLNLTGADTVVFYDHDWNPANDRQAQDRAWRIGQTKPVNVYRLVTQGTLEEKILARQALKLQLADAIVREDVSSLRDLTSADLVNLFRFTEAEAS